MSEAEAKEILTLSLSQHVFRNLSLHAATARLDFDCVIEAALDEYLSAIEQCEPDVRELVRKLVPLPIEPH